jgi:hypothetical protein
MHDKYWVRWMECGQGGGVLCVTDLPWVLVGVVGEYALPLRHLLWQPFVQHSTSISNPSQIGSICVPPPPPVVKYCPPASKPTCHDHLAHSLFTVGECCEWTILIQGQGTWFSGITLLSQVADRKLSADSLCTVSTSSLYVNHRGSPCETENHCGIRGESTFEIDRTNICDYQHRFTKELPNTVLHVRCNLEQQRITFYCNTWIFCAEFTIQLCQTRLLGKLEAYTPFIQLAQNSDLTPSTATFTND